MKFSRRSSLLAAAGVVAGVTGVAAQRWRGAGSGAAPEAAGSGADPAGGLWTLRFPTPDDGELAMQALRGAPLLLNFWATWCPPCVKEMPELDRFAQRFRASNGGRVVGLAIDSPTPVKNFLARTPVGYAIGLAGLDGTDLSRRLGNGGGALPFSALFDKRGLPVQRKLGELDFRELQNWVTAL